MVEINLNFSINQELIDQMPGYFAIMDLNSKFLFSNKTTLKMTGFKSSDAMVNLTYSDMHCKASEKHDSFVIQDKTTENIDKPLGILGYYCYADSWKILFGEKYPLKDSNRNTIAIAHYFTDITNYNFIDLSKFFSLTNDASSIKIYREQVSYELKDNYPGVLLPHKQSECLFFLIRGKTIKEIAKILNLSPRTVETHVEKIKLKLNCSRRSELIEKAITSGYANIIPKTLLKTLI